MRVLSATTTMGGAGGGALGSLGSMGPPAAVTAGVTNDSDDDSDLGVDDDDVDRMMLSDAEVRLRWW